MMTLRVPSSVKWKLSHLEGCLAIKMDVDKYLNNKPKYLCLVFYLLQPIPLSTWVAAAIY